MASLAASRRSDFDTRVRDYLDDKLQTPADFAGLDALLRQARNQQELLRQQLNEANTDLDQTTNALRDHETSIRGKVEAFQQQQSDIDRQLLHITAATTSDDAVRTFESSMGKLRRLDLARGYLQLLQEVESVAKQAQDTCQTSTRSALPAYTRLRSLAHALQVAQPAAEGAAPHLVDHVEQLASRVYTQLNEAASSELSKTLEQMRWPQKELLTDGKTIGSWTDQVNTLLDLQEPDLKSQSIKQQHSPSAAEGIILLPLEVMVGPLQLRFRYHFFGNRPTNRLDKPEYYLSHILDILEDHSGFLLDYLQPVLDERWRSLPDLDDPIYTDATSAFISALLPMLKAKIMSHLPQVASQPQLLSHFMHELMSFDTTLRDVWAFTPNPHSVADWKGLTWSVLVTHDYFNTWLQIEKDFALARYEAIISTPDSRDIDYESTEAGSTKPTKSAIRVNDLLETITERYRPLSSFSQKLRFLIDIQLEIFDLYHQRLHGSLERYMMDTSTLGKVMQTSTGTTPEARNKNDVIGMFGLESLCKVFGSAEYLERKMSDWSDDVFFLELWDELQDRARQTNGQNGSVGRNLTTSEVASRTSATITQANQAEGGETDGGALFNETATAYRRLRMKAEDQINDLLTNAVTTALRSYSKVTGWASLSSEPATAAASLSPSPALDPTRSLLSELLPFLAKVLAPAPLRRITRQLCLAMQKYIWDNVLLRHHFSASGAAQLAADLDAIAKLVDSSTHVAGEAARGMRKLYEGVRLLGLPIRSWKGGKRGSVAVEPGGAEDGWGFDDGDEEDREGGDDDDEEEEREEEAEDGQEGGGSNKVWSLWEVERRVFESNESARKALAAVGLQTLNESDARMVLERRVEVGS